MTVEIERLSRSVDRQQLVAQARENSVVKGVDFEGDLLNLLHTWKVSNKAIIEHIGTDNKGGDIVVHMGGVEMLHSAAKLKKKGLMIPEESFKILIEAKNINSSNRLGRKQIDNVVANIVKIRQADAVIVVGSTAAAFAKEIGEFDEGFASGKQWCACIPENLTTTLRYVHLQLKLARAMQAMNDPNSLSCVKLKGHVQEIRSAMADATQVKRRATEIKKLAEMIHTDAATMQTSIKKLLDEMDQELAITM